MLCWQFFWRPHPCILVLPEWQGVTLPTLCPEAGGCVHGPAVQGMCVYIWSAAPTHLIAAIVSFGNPPMNIGSNRTMTCVKVLGLGRRTGFAREPAPWPAHWS
jgi:hypothetical protein